MKFPSVASCLLLLTTAWAQPSRGGPIDRAGVSAARLPLGVESIREFVEQSAVLRGLDLSNARIVPPPDFTTRSENPGLELRSIQPDARHHALFLTLRCREHRACGSFLVEMLLRQGLPNSVRNWRAGVLRTLSAPAETGHQRLGSAGPFLVERDKPAQLLIDEDGLRITELVVPLKPAGLGGIVRVNDPATHRSMLAEVTGPGLLRAAVDALERRPGGRQ